MNPTSVMTSNATANEKLGKGLYATTSASQVTCPETCPLLNGGGCYTEGGPMSWSVTKKLNASVDNALQVARAEAKAIKALPGDKPLRIHVVGDAKTNAAAKIVSAAASEYKRRSAKPVHSYTHAWQTVERSSWKDISVLASCETIADCKRAMAREYAAAIIVPAFKSRQSYEQDGVRVIPCPNQTTKDKDGNKITCFKCKLCTKDQWLRETNAVIAFEPHGQKKNALTAKLIQINAN